MSQRLNKQLCFFEDAIPFLFLRLLDYHGSVGLLGLPGLRQAVASSQGGGNCDSASPAANLRKTKL